MVSSTTAAAALSATEFSNDGSEVLNSKTHQSDPRVEDEKLALESILEDDFEVMWDVNLSSNSTKQWQLKFPINISGLGSSEQSESDSQDHDGGKKAPRFKLLIFLPHQYPDLEPPVPVLDVDSLEDAKQQILKAIEKKVRKACIKAPIKEYEKVESANQIASGILNSLLSTEDFFQNELLDVNPNDLESTTLGSIFQQGECCVYDWYASIQERLDQRVSMVEDSFQEELKTFLQENDDDEEVNTSESIAKKIAACDAGLTGEERFLLNDLRNYEMGQGAFDYKSNTDYNESDYTKTSDFPQMNLLKTNHESDSCEDGVWIEEGVYSCSNYGPGKAFDNNYKAGQKIEIESESDNEKEEGNEDEYMEFGYDARIRGYYMANENQNGSKNKQKGQFNKSNSSESGSKNKDFKIDLIHGEAFTEKKSTFQAHLAIVNSKDDVSRALEKLYEDTKIRRATHNQYAYKIEMTGEKGTPLYLTDNDDDGESGAGKKLSELLELTKPNKNVLVIVSRWYGGVQMGNDRFKCINRAARDLLKRERIIN